MRAAVVLALVAACSFHNNQGAGTTDGSTVDTSHDPIDAAIDAHPIDAAPLCPGNYAQVAGAPPTSKYRLFSYNAQLDDHTSSWTDAKQTCATDGTHLIIVETAAEATAIGGALHYAPQSPFFWEGVTDAAQEGVWKTVLGSDATYLPWAPGQPNGGAASNCALFGTDGALSDFTCSGVEPFACECD